MSIPGCSCMSAGVGGDEVLGKCKARNLAVPAVACCSFDRMSMVYPGVFRLDVGNCCALLLDGRWNGLMGVKSIRCGDDLVQCSLAIEI